jgi:hypothetical protein
LQETIHSPGYRHVQATPSTESRNADSTGDATDSCCGLGHTDLRLDRNRHPHLCGHRRPDIGFNSRRLDRHN